MSLETENLNLFYQILIPSISSIASVFVIGWKIKDALCKQISEMKIDLGIHKGISEPFKKEMTDKISKINARLDKIIYENNLKV